MIGPGIKGQRLVALFLLGVLLLNYPLLNLFASDGRILGVPVLYAYVFSAWALVIALMALVVEKRGDYPPAPTRVHPMLSAPVIAVTSFAYLGLLFAIAYYGDKRADQGRSIIANPYIYALSLAVYCTSWTFYGSVGRAATSGIGFLPIYLGPTLMAALWRFVLVKITRVSKANG